MKLTPSADYEAKLKAEDEAQRVLVPMGAYVTLVVLAIFLAIVLFFSGWAIYAGNERLNCLREHPAGQCPVPAPLERIVRQLWLLN